MHLDDFRQMRREHGYGIDDRIAVELCLLSLIFGNPQCRKTEGRLRRLDAWHFFEHRARVHREVVIEHELTARRLNSLELDDVIVRLDLYVIAYANRRHDEAKFQRALSSDHNDAFQKIAALPRIDKRYETVADLKLHRVNLQQIDNILGLCCIGLRFLRLLLLGHFFNRLL